MENTTKEVDAKTQVASPATEIASTEEIDYAEELEKVLLEKSALEEERNKALRDRDNYKTGLLKAKGKISDDGDDEDSILDRKIDERIFFKREAEIRARESEVIKNLALKNKELTLALKNKGISKGNPTSTETIEVRKSNLSPEQVADLKKRGWDDKKISMFEKNLQKNAR